jgi:two-component system LytT family sensor kinase
MSGPTRSIPPFVPRGRAAVWLASFVVFTVAGVLSFYYRYLDDVARSRPDTFGRRLIEESTGAYAALFLFIGVIALYMRFPVDRKEWRRSAPVHAVAAILYSLAHTSLLAITRQVIYSALGWGVYDYGIMRVRYAMEFPNDLGAYCMFLGMITLVRYYNTIRDRELRAEQLERGLAQAQLRNLRLQLQPHFLFNALNTISSTMYEDPRTADRMIGQLSDLLRMSLRTSHAHETTLAEEIEVLEQYIGIMRVRFGDRMCVETNVDPDTMDALVPSLLLQPLVENAVRHGNTSRLGRGRIGIQGHRDGGTLVLEVTDDGPGAPDDIDLMTRGVGLRATADRLRMLYRDAHSFSAGNDGHGGFAVRMRFPLRSRPGKATPIVHEGSENEPVLAAHARSDR